MSPGNGEGRRPTIEYEYYPNGDIKYETLYVDWNGMYNIPDDPICSNYYEYDSLGRKTLERMGSPYKNAPSTAEYSYQYDDDANDGLRGTKESNNSYTFINSEGVDYHPDATTLLAKKCNISA